VTGFCFLVTDTAGPGAGASGGFRGAGRVSGVGIRWSRASRDQSL